MSISPRYLDRQVAEHGLLLEDVQACLQRTTKTMVPTQPIRPDIVARFETQRTPRYTSYPTAPHFTHSIADSDYRRLLEAIPSDTSLSLYLHIPFCRTMCWYCGCNTRVASNDRPVQNYLEKLRSEVQMVAAALPKRMKVRHIHWGGGTPSIVAPDAFSDLMELLDRHFDLAPDAEIAIEIDPRRLSDAMIRALGDNGVTRASLGVQSFDPRVQNAINRVQTFEQSSRASDALRAAGISSVNVDLIYGLPHETVASCEETVAQALKLKPDQLSAFGYAHVPWLKKHQRALQEQFLPDPSQRLAQFSAIADSLAGAGYQRIGLDHFARPGDRLSQCLRDGKLHRNFQGYTGDQCPTLLGFGASAIGTLPDAYVQNATDIGDYGRKIDAGSLAIERGRRLSADDRVRRDVIERLMCDFEVDLDAVASAHGVRAQYFSDERDRLGALQRDGIVDIRGEVISIDRNFWALVRTVASVFDAYKRPEEQRHAAAI